MPGQIHRLLETIIEKRSQGNATVALTTKTKLVLKGLNPDRYTTLTEDRPEIMARVRVVAKELGVTL